MPSTAVSTLADLLEGPLLSSADHKGVQLRNVDAAVLHGVFNQEEVKEILTRMKALGKGGKMEPRQRWEVRQPPAPRKVPLLTETSANADTPKQQS